MNSGKTVATFWDLAVASKADGNFFIGNVNTLQPASTGWPTITGLVAGHNYSLLDVVKLSNGVQLI